uniref:DNA modification methylase n=1 Tax=Aeromonas sp. Ne-1 TaxID=1675689 RepID=A0A0H4J975_9GAMM|nr:hypothetical protein [Aeromonas sp. Ne-1]AKO69690.1 DNA modification methylase [Aeromonas sp. Ne-1]
MTIESTILSYPNRGKWGKSSYRGNCSGHIIKDLLEHYKPQKFLEVFSGSGTGKEVALDLGITNSVHLDLNNGFNILSDDIPTGFDFAFSHPPYWDIIHYETQRGQAHEGDLSNPMDYEEFIKKLDLCNSKIYSSMANNGRYAFLIGDVRKKGKYYSIIKDMAWIGDLEVHVIKEQHNTVSGRKSYYSNSFIPIAHEHLLIFKKNQIWQVPIKFTHTRVFDLRAFENNTWRDLIQGALEYLGGQADLTSIYNLIKDSKKTKKNQNWKEKVRQTLQINTNFSPVERGIWKLDIA